MYLLHQLLERSAVTHGTRTAVVDGERRITYAELEARANQLAHLLLSNGIQRGDRVGLHLDKSIEALVGIYGALKAGAAYVPLDPQAPVARVGYIAANCGIRVLVTASSKRSRWCDLVDAAPDIELLVVLDEPAPPADPSLAASILGTERLDGHPSTSPDVTLIDLDLAYILYTSGSTGEPKGVKLSHLNALSFVNWAGDEFGISADDRLSSHSPLHFDLSVFDLFAAARSGAAVFLVPPGASVFPAEIKRFIEAHEITVWYSVPSVLSALVLRGGLELGCLPRLRTILFAGEVFPTKYLRQLMAALPHVRFANLYGPTETNVCTWYEVPALADGDDSPIPIGRAITNVDCIVVGDDGRLLPPGEVGELLVRGTTVMQGYWADPERTDRGLVANPRDAGSLDRAYRTGDLVVDEGDGVFSFLGRRDSQIKSRGYRIELGDIEAALYSHPGVLECGVVPVPDEVFTNRIKAFVVARDGLDDKQLARHCADRIPKYMIPEIWEFRDTLAKTPTGKLDRQALKT